MPADTTASEPSRTPRERYRDGLFWHLGSFVIMNVSFWILDLGLGQAGAQWAFWITGFWGFPVAFHLLAYMVDGRNR